MDALCTPPPPHGPKHQTPCAPNPRCCPVALTRTGPGESSHKTFVKDVMLLSNRKYNGDLHQHVSHVMQQSFLNSGVSGDACQNLQPHMKLT